MKDKIKIPKENVVILIICCVCGLGCLLVWFLIEYNKTAGFQFSELKVEDELTLQIVGTVKNVSGKDCKELKVEYEAKNGSIVDTGFFYLDNVKNGKSYSFDDLFLASDESNLDAYKIKVTNVECQND